MKIITNRNIQRIQNVTTQFLTQFAYIMAQVMHVPVHSKAPQETTKKVPDSVPLNKDNSLKSQNAHSSKPTSPSSLKQGAASQPALPKKSSRPKW